MAGSAASLGTQVRRTSRCCSSGTRARSIRRALPISRRGSSTSPGFPKSGSRQQLDLGVGLDQALRQNQCEVACEPLAAGGVTLAYTLELVERQLETYDRRIGPDVGMAPSSLDQCHLAELHA